MIKAAITSLGHLHLRASRRVLRSFDQALANVSSEYRDARALSEVHFTRLNGHYRPAIELAKVILRSTAIELWHGQYHASGFLVDMNQVSENFVVIALREALGLRERQFPQNAEGEALALDAAHRVRLEPDLSWWNGRSCLFVGNAKYRRVNHEGIKHADLYQLLAYTIATGLDRGMLIYAAGEAAPVVHDIAMVDKQLEVVSLDLTGTPDEILAQIASVAERIRAGIMMGCHAA